MPPALGQKPAPPVAGAVVVGDAGGEVLAGEVAGGEVAGGEVAAGVLGDDEAAVVIGLPDGLSAHQMP